MYDDNTWRSIDIESDEPYAWYTRTLAGRFVDAWLDEHVEGNHPLTGAHLREIIGDFQDLVWNAFGDDAIQLETVPTTGHQEQDFDRHIPKVPELIDDLVEACTPAP